MNEIPQDGTLKFMQEKVLIIVPAFNEEESLGKVLNELATLELTTWKLFVCVINDGSVDRTAQIAEKFPITLINLPVNLGVGGAIRSGYRYAHVNNFSRVVHFDADGQHSMHHIETILEHLNDNDLVIGSRYLDKNYYPAKFHVRTAQVILSLLIKIFHGLKISDPTSGFRASKGKLIEIYSKTYPVNFLSDTIGSTIQAKHHGFKISEIFTPMIERKYGKSSQGVMKRTKYFLLSATLIIFWRDGGL
jgi:glycosyltransferase involved in cell wall biosynthesis